MAKKKKASNARPWLLLGCVLIIADIALLVTQFYTLTLVDVLGLIPGLLIAIYSFRKYDELKS